MKYMNMKTNIRSRAIGLLILLAPFVSGAQRVVQFDRISAYHSIQVYDENGKRTLSFNGSWETTMSLTNTLAGHFEYTEYFQMPWLWNTNIHRVLMEGLGGGSTPRAYQHYFTNVMVDVVEIDPVVVEVAKKYFTVAESPTLKINIQDGRVFLRQTTNVYDVILMDAYSTTTYGSSLPRQLTTKEFFTLASQHLSTNGVLAYNVIGQIQGNYRANVIGAIYRTMKEVFPQVYMFPADESLNVVIIGTKSKENYDIVRVWDQARALISSGTVTLPTFNRRAGNFTNRPPPNVAQSPVLTDDYAPIESLLNGKQ